MNFAGRQTAGVVRAADVERLAVGLVARGDGTGRYVAAARVHPSEAGAGQDLQMETRKANICLTKHSNIRNGIGNAREREM